MRGRVDGLVADAERTLHRLRPVLDRRQAFDSVREHPLQKPLMSLWAGRADDDGLVRAAWRHVAPSGAERPFAQDEATA